MKKFFMSILSLSTLFIFSAITHASEPSNSEDKYETPCKIEFRKPQSSEYLRGKSRQHVRNYSSLSLGLDSSSEAVDFVLNEISALSEEEQGQEISNTEAEEVLIFIEETTGSPSFVDMKFSDSEDEHPLQKLLESSKRTWQ